jgi:hypothetical protein
MTGSLCSLPLNSFRHDRLHWVVNENSISPTLAIHDRQIQPDHWMAATGSSPAAAMPLNQRPQWPSTCRSIRWMNARCTSKAAVVQSWSEVRSIEN